MKPNAHHTLVRVKNDASFYAVERRSGKGIKEMIFMERDCKSLPMYRVLQQMERNLSVVEDVGFEPLLHIPNVVCCHYTTSSIYGIL